MSNDDEKVVSVVVRKRGPQSLGRNALPLLKTHLAKRGFDPDTAIAELGKSVPIGHVADPDEIADVILFLASDDARYMCGSIIEVNGGKPVK